VKPERLQDSGPPFYSRPDTEIETAKKNDGQNCSNNNNDNANANLCHHHQYKDSENSAELWRKAGLVSTSGYHFHGLTGANSAEVVMVTTLPRSRDRRQPITDVAPAHQHTADAVKPTVSSLLEGGNRKLAIVGKPEVTSSQQQRVALETFRPIRRTQHVSDHDVIDPSQSPVSSKQSADINRLSNQILRPCSRLCTVRDSRSIMHTI